MFADRRATARTTTFVEPCSIQIKKKTLWAFCQVSNLTQLTCRTPLSLSVPSPNVYDPLAVSLLNDKIKIMVTTSYFPTGMTPLRKCTKLKPWTVNRDSHNCNQGIFTLFAIHKEKYFGSAPRWQACTSAPLGSKSKCPSGHDVPALHAAAAMQTAMRPQSIIFRLLVHHFHRQFDFSLKKCCVDARNALQDFLQVTKY